MNSIRSDIDNSTATSPHVSNYMIGYVFLLAVGFFISSLCVFIASSNPAHGYELSIYEETPSLFWAGITFLLLLGLFSIYDSQRRKATGGYYVGTLMILLSTLLIALLSTLRGYPIYGSPDHIVHINSIWNILGSGHLNPSDFYPSIHLLLTSSSVLLGTGPEGIQFLSPLILMTSFPIISFILGRMISGDSRVGCFAAIIGCAFFFNSLSVMIYPFILSMILVGFMMILLLKCYKGSIENRLPVLIALVLLIAAIVISHPVGVVVVATTGIIIGLSSAYRNDKIMMRFNFSIALIIVSILLVWLLSQPVLESAIRSFAFYLTNPTMNIGITTANEVGTNLGLIGSIILFLKLYYDTIIVTVMALIGWRILIKRKIGWNHSGRLATPFGLVLIAMIFAQFLAFFLSRETAGRFLNGAFFMIMAIPLAAFPMFVGWSSLKRVGKLIPFLIVITLIFGSYWAVYHSSLVNQAGWMITEDGIAATDWMKEKTIDGGSIANLGIDLVDRRISFTIDPQFTNIYNGSEFIKHSPPWFIIIGERAIRVAEDPFLRNYSVNAIDGPGFNSSDYQKFETFDVFSKIYDAGGTSIYYSRR